jgi:phosphohistidine swiveling domain-containing protein
MNADTQLHVWQGLSASPGKAAGKAHVIRTEQDLEATEQHCILVARHATPALFPSLVEARAAVCETGGVLNHLAVLARELGKPCVTNLPGIVAALETGMELRVDGTNGVVEAIAPRQQAGVSVAHAAKMELELIPIFQFGLFSAAFEQIQAFFDIEMVVRAAALASLPLIFGSETEWNFVITDNKILVGASDFRRTVDMLVDRLEDQTLNSGEVHRRYLDVCAWHGWSSLHTDHFDWLHLRTALRYFVNLNQFTWLASVAKEPLSKRYHSFLFDRLAHLSEAQRNQLFLDSLIMPDHSYILRSYLLGDSSTPWSATIPDNGHAGSNRDTTVTTTQELTNDAQRQYGAALQYLKGQLSEQDLQRVLSYVSTLADLVDLTERKNTELYRCGRALFGTSGHQEAIAALCGIDAADRSDFGSEEGRRWLIERVLNRLRDWDDFGPELGGGGASTV